MKKDFFSLLWLFEVLKDHVIFQNCFLNTWWKYLKFYAKFKFQFLYVAVKYRDCSKCNSRRVDKLWNIKRNYSFYLIFTRHFEKDLSKANFSVNTKLLLLHFIRIIDRHVIVSLKNFKIRFNAELWSDKFSNYYFHKNIYLTLEMAKLFLKIFSREDQILAKMFSS